VLECDYDDSSTQEFTASNHQLAQLRSLIAQVPGGGSPELRAWIARVQEKPAADLLGPLGDFTQRLAERLRKKVDFSLVGGTLMIDPGTTRPLLHSLTHLIRNAVDHGIEESSSRGNKPARGQVVVEVKVSPASHEFNVTVSDDGRGIDLPKLRKRAVEKGLRTQAEVDAMPNGAIELIFLDGLSAAETTTNISGRGVGMSAVRAIAEAAGGTLRVSSATGAGTQITLVFPAGAR
jgi:two-component system chemotaxis sensor kinase CheA